MTEYIIIITNQDGTTCTHAFDNIEKFNNMLEKYEEAFYNDVFTALETTVHTIYERYPVD